jgi:hypothetical protein
MKTKELIVQYEVQEYKGDALLCQYSSEYTRDLKAKVKQSKFLNEKLGETVDYRFFKRILRALSNGTYISEVYEVTESEII